MANIFDEFDKKVGSDFQKKVQEASENQYEEVPKGKYIAKIEKMEFGMSIDKLFRLTRNFQKQILTTILILLGNSKTSR